MRGKALNAKYSVSLCLPFLSGTLPPPELFTADLEDDLERLRVKINRLRMTGEWNICIGPVEQWRYYFYLLFVRIVVSPWLLTWLANYKRASRSGRFFCCYKIFPFFIRILTFWNRKYKYYCLYLSFITLYPSFITFLWQAFCDRWPL